MLAHAIPLAEGSIYAYLLIDLQGYDILDGNKLAWTFYKNGAEYPPLDSLFHIKGTSIYDLIKNLDETTSSSCSTVTSTKMDGEIFSCHIELWKINSAQVFLVVKEQESKENTVNQLIEVTGNPIFVLEQDEFLSLSYGNEHYYQNFHPDKDCQHKSSHFSSLLPVEKRLAFVQTVQEKLDFCGECELDIELNFGTEYVQLFRFSAFKSTYDGKLYGVLISVKKQRELIKKIEYDQQYFDIMQKFSKDLLFRIDIKKRTLVHRGDISMFTALLPVVKNFPESVRELRYVHPDDLEGYIAFSYRLMSGVEASFEARFQFKNGTFEKYRLQASPLYDMMGNVIQIVGKSENIQQYAEIEAKANYDTLTTTLNKQSFKELIQHQLNHAVVSDKFALLFLDLDDFKSVNDTMGHVFGDFLLEATAKRILNCIRSQDKVGRVGGDEFVIFFQLAPNADMVLERAEAILYSLRREFTLGEQRYKTRGSIGIALYPEHGTEYDLLYDRADKALYESKRLGKDLATLYGEDLD